MRRLLTASLPAFTALAAGVVLAAGASGSPAAPPCKGASLSGLFSLVPGSPGAGNVVYVLQVRNRSASACFVSGLPAVRLLGLRHRALPTHAFAARPGQLTAVRVQLAPGAYTSASARFSPDIPGEGESVRGACEPKAFFLRVRPQGGGSLLAAVRPPTSVCEHGGMSFTAFVAGRRVPTP